MNIKKLSEPPPGLKKFLGINELFYMVSDSIKKFQPSRKYGNEFSYHTDFKTG